MQFGHRSRLVVLAVVPCVIPFWAVLDSQEHAMHGHSAVWVASRGEMIVLGNASASVDETLAVYGVRVADRSLTSVDWRPIEVANPDEAPTRRRGQTAVVDSSSDRIIVFGGIEDNGTYDRDVYEMQLNGDRAVFRKFSPTTGPSGRAWHTAVYDDSADRMLVYGGAAEGAVFDEMWSLDLSESDFLAWRMMPPAPGDIPPPLYGHSAAIYSANRRGRFMMVFGGFDGCSLNGDL